MWKRGERAQPQSSASIEAPPSDPGSAPTAVAPDPEPADDVAPVVPRSPDTAGSGTIGPSVSITGRLSGSEDLYIDGTVDGTVVLEEHALTVGPHGRIDADVVARAVTVLGRVTGNITAAETIIVENTGTVTGDLRAPRVAIVEGATVRGMVDMGQTGSPLPPTVSVTDADGAQVVEATEDTSAEAHR